MRFPFSLTCSMGRYLLTQKRRRIDRFPMVLMLEPLHRCNLHCRGCGRVREYAATLHHQMSLEECLASIDECSAPIVSLCGGEPLLYEPLPDLIEGILERKKHIYLCTNGTLLAQKLDQLLACSPGSLKKRLFLNVHLDGPESIHDAITQPGTFQQALHGIQRAKSAGLFVYTNTTVYRPTTVDSLIELADVLHTIPIDGMMISPGFGFPTLLKPDRTNNSGDNPKTSTDTKPDPCRQTSEQEPPCDLFLTRPEIEAFFQEVRRRMKKYPLTATPVFLDFLCGQLDLVCAAWANPTRTPAGWRSPCYLICDRHYATYQELLSQTDWSTYRTGKDPRCQNCMTHCGYEPASVLQVRKISSLFRLALWQIFG